MGKSMSMAPMGGGPGHLCSRGCGADIGSPANQDEHNKTHLNLRGASDVFGMIDATNGGPPDDDDFTGGNAPVEKYDPGAP